MAFAVARNAWLYPYAADSPEVQALVQFYQNAQALASTPSDSIRPPYVPIGTQPIPLPQLWLCQLALSSAPFSIGLGEKGDEMIREACASSRPARADVHGVLVVLQRLDRRWTSTPNSSRANRGYLQFVLFGTSNRWTFHAGRGGCRRPQGWRFREIGPEVRATGRRRFLEYEYVNRNSWEPPRLPVPQRFSTCSDTPAKG